MAGGKYRTQWPGVVSSPVSKFWTPVCVWEILNSGLEAILASAMVDEKRCTRKVWCLYASLSMCQCSQQYSTCLKLWSTDRTGVSLRHNALFRCLRIVVVHGHCVLESASVTRPSSKVVILVCVSGARHNLEVRTSCLPDVAQLILAERKNLRVCLVHTAKNLSGGWKHFVLAHPKCHTTEKEGFSQKRQFGSFTLQTSAPTFGWLCGRRTGGSCIRMKFSSQRKVCASAVNLPELETETFCTFSIEEREWPCVKKNLSAGARWAVPAHAPCRFVAVFCSNKLCQKVLHKGSWNCPHRGNIV